MALQRNRRQKSGTNNEWQDTLPFHIKNSPLHRNRNCRHLVRILVMPGIPIPHGLMVLSMNRPNMPLYSAGRASIPAAIVAAIHGEPAVPLSCERKNICCVPG